MKRKKIMLALITGGCLVLTLLIILTVVLVNGYIKAENETKAYAVKMKSFTAEETVEQCFKWANAHNYDRLDQLFLNDDSYWFKDIEYIWAYNIRESTAPIDECYKRACPPSWEIKNFYATVDFKYKYEIEERSEYGWEFLLTRENSESPWLIVWYSTKP
jgi:hypothetical protein